jgi:hypothetical protein
MVPVKLIESIPDRQREAALAAMNQHAPTLARLKLKPLRWGKIPSGVEKMYFDNKVWDVETITDFEKPLPIPLDLLDKCEQTKGIFQRYLWAEEHFDYPNFVPMVDGSARVLSDYPEFIPSLPPFSLPSSTNTPVRQQVRKSFWERLGEWLDPAVIGVIITDYKTMSGWFVLIGQWNH